MIGVWLRKDGIGWNWDWTVACFYERMARGCKACNTVLERMQRHEYENGFAQQRSCRLSSFEGCLLSYIVILLRIYIPRTISLSCSLCRSMNGMCHTFIIILAQLMVEMGKTCDIRP